MCPTNTRCDYVKTGRRNGSKRRKLIKKKAQLMNSYIVPIHVYMNMHEIFLVFIYVLSNCPSIF